MMITHIVGNRPQFIKLAPLYHEIRKRGYLQRIIHTGQHYDDNMSDVFFRELDIPKAEINLGIGSGTHGEMTAKALVGIEKALTDTPTDLAILYGDTDTTLAAAIAISKLNVKIAHVEGGTRTYNENNPEEKNRIITDHLSNIIFAPDTVSQKNAEMEGLGNRTFYTGDIMFDTYLEISSREFEKEKLDTEEEIILMTWHRQENTANRERMEKILSLLEKIDSKIVCPMHPRTVKCLKSFDLWQRIKSITNLEIIEPVGYVEMVSLMKRARLIITDSGGLSKESSFAGAKCIFLMTMKVWPELVESGWITNVDFEDETSIDNVFQKIKEARKVPFEKRPQLFGDGKAAAKMADLLEINGYL